MEVGWSPYGAFSVAVGIMTLTLGVAVYAHGRRSVTATRITALLLAEGLSMTFATGIGFFMLEARGAIAARLTGDVLMVAIPAAQLLIIGTLDTPLGRPFRGRRAVVILWSLSGLAAATVFLWPGFWVLGSEPGELTPHRVTNGPGLNIVMFATMLAATYSLVANIHAYRRSREPSKRQRAKAFAFAYGTRDVTLLALGSVWWANAELGDVIGFPLTVGLYLPILAYGFLRGQLFDINLRLRRAALRGVAVTFVVGLYFLIVQGSGFLLSTQWGQGLSLAAVALAAFTVVPVDRGVSHMAERWFPESPDLDARKLAVYRQALAEAVAADGALSRKSQRMLRKLRMELGLTDRDHHVVIDAVMSVRHDAPPMWKHGEIVLGAYEIVHPLGVGGRTWLATRRGKQFVVKMSRAVAREEEILALRHPNVVRLVEAGQASGHSVLVLEHAGQALSEVLQTAALERNRWVGVAMDLMSGLSALHEKGFVHGDLKPANVILAEDGTARLADFDVARLPGTEVTLAARADNLPVGTLRYMSPEQAHGQGASVHSDVFSAAATLYEALIGEPWLPVVPGETAHELRQRAVRGRNPAPDLVETPLREWFGRALAREPTARYANAHEMQLALSEALRRNEAISSGPGLPVTRASPKPA